jgi:hypothetical protein
VSATEAYLAELTRRGYRPEDEPRFIAAWECLEKAYLVRIEAAAAPFEGWRDRFRAVATETARLVESHIEEARFLVVDAFRAGEIGSERQRRFGARLAAFVDSAREELPEPDLVPSITAHWIVAMFFDRIYRRCSGTGRDLPSQLPELLFLAIGAYYGTDAGLRELTPPR